MSEASISRDCTAIVLDGSVSGPDGERMVQFILDTGASITMIPGKVIQKIGSSTIITARSVHIQTAGGTVDVDIVRVDSIEIMGKTVKNIEVASFDLPTETRVEGLLGLNFLKHFRMTLDFPNGKLSLV